VSTDRNETSQSFDRKKTEDFYHKYISLAQEAQKSDRVLSESYYQLAEHYLHARNESSNSDHATCSSAKKTGHTSQGAKTDPSGEDGTTPASPFRGSFLRRNRRGVPRKGGV